MKIESIETIDLAAPLARPFHWSTGTATERRTTLVRVVTDGGVEGWGEAAYGGVAGAIDIATWDASARTAGVPLAAMLSAHFAREVDVYASGLYYGDGDEAEEARRHLAGGFGKMKMKIGRLTAEDDLARVRAVRDAIGDAELMVDANGAYDVAAALQIAPALRELGVRWLEEPMRCDDTAAYRTLRARSSVPIAAGESLDFVVLERWIEQAAIDVVQPNVSASGGVAAALDVLRLAVARGVRPAVHAWGTPVMTAAALHVAAAAASRVIVEIDRTPNPLRAIAADFAVNAGTIAIPDRPGLGIDVDLDMVERHRVRSAA